MNQIHPTAVIDSDVVLGDNNYIGPFAHLTGNVILGDGNWIGSHAVIGSPAQMRGGAHPPLSWSADKMDCRVVVGSRNVIREFVTVQSPTTGTTTIGDDCYLMTQAHVPHDASIGNFVTLSNSVQVGGHTTILDGANIGLGSVIHQHVVIGQRVMIGMGSVVTKDVLPYSMAYGSPARIKGSNFIGMQRQGLSENRISAIEEALASGDVEKLSHVIPDEMREFLSAIQVQNR
jgi:UDP-N-acetylglucosamine acyltransferase